MFSGSHSCSALPLLRLQGVLRRLEEGCTASLTSTQQTDRDSEIALNSKPFEQTFLTRNLSQSCFAVKTLTFKRSASETCNANSRNTHVWDVHLLSATWAAPRHFPVLELSCFGDLDISCQPSGSLLPTSSFSSARRRECVRMCMCRKSQQNFGSIKE